MKQGLGLSFLRRAGRRTAYEPGRTLCFMHVPKAAGTSLRAGLETALEASAVQGFDHVLFGGFTDFASFGALERQRVFGAPGMLPPGADLVAGHFAYSTLRAAYPDAALMTVLREPVTRLLSLWMFWRLHTDDDLAGLGTWADCVRLAQRPLKAFLGEAKIAAQTDNVALRMLLWPDALIPVDGFIDPAHDRVLQRRALRRLHSFGFSAVVESPDLHGRLAAWLGREVPCVRHNETDRMPPERRAALAPLLDDAALDLLDERSRLDCVLWRAVGGFSSADGARLRQRAMLRCVARYGALMAAGLDANTAK